MNTVAMLLDARKHLVDRAIETLQIEELRTKAEVESRAFPGSQYLGSLRKDILHEIPLFTNDNEFASQLNLNRNLAIEVQDSPVIAIFETPKPIKLDGPHGDEAWHMLLKNLKSNVLLRFGFFESELDIIESALQGFRGITIFTRRLDEFMVQYLTEVCRDMRMSCIHIVDSPNDLEKVLKTDSPYIGIWGFQPEKPLLAWDFMCSMATQIPSNCASFAFSPSLSKPQKDQLKVLGIRGVC